MNSLSPLDGNPIAYLGDNELGNLQFDNYNEILAIPRVRYYLTLKRWELFCKTGVSVQVYNEHKSGVIGNTVGYSIQGIVNSLESIASLERSELVFRPLMAMDRVYSYTRRSVFPELSALLIGSRTEYEVLLAFGYGFQPERLSAIDLISYSPWITPGDMHALPFADNSFDIIILGWVLGYSKTPRVVANEIVRVARSGAVVSIGNDCATEESLRASEFYSDERPRTVRDLVECFGSSAGEMIFSHNPHYTRGDVPGFTGHLISTFEIRK
jgi:hypothetical protein